jgi:ribose transport system substrate-binding protein
MNRRAKRGALILVTASTVATSLVACSSSPSSNSGGGGAASTAPTTAAAATSGGSSGASCSGATVAYASFQENNAYFAVVDKGIQNAAKKAGVNLYMVDNDLNADRAITNANLIAARPGVKVVLESNYYQSENATIGKIFSRANIPAIAVDIAIPGSPYYGANNEGAGELAGKGLVSAANAKWGSNSVDLALVEMQSGPGQELIQQRTKGIVAGIKAADPSLPTSSIIQFEGGNNADAAGSAVEAQLPAHPNAKHIIIGMLGDSNGVAASKAAQVAGRASQVLIAGQGGDGVGVTTLEGPASTFIGTTDYRPSNYGNDLIALACQIIEGKSIPPMNYIKHIFLTPANVRKYYPNGQS